MQLVVGVGVQDGEAAVLIQLHFLLQKGPMALRLPGGFFIIEFIQMNMISISGVKIGLSLSFVLKFHISGGGALNIIGDQIELLLLVGAPPGPLRGILP